MSAEIDDVAGLRHSSLSQIYSIGFKSADLTAMAASGSLENHPAGTFLSERAIKGMQLTYLVRCYYNDQLL
jgi:hypothetical protein